MKSGFLHVKSQILLCILYGIQSQRLNNFKVIKPERFELRKFQMINYLTKGQSKLPALLGILKLIWLKMWTSNVHPLRSSHFNDSEYLLPGWTFFWNLSVPSYWKLSLLSKWAKEGRLWLGIQLFCILIPTKFLSFSPSLCFSICEWQHHSVCFSVVYQLPQSCNYSIEKEC